MQGRARIPDDEIPHRQLGVEEFFLDSIGSAANKLKGKFMKLPLAFDWRFMAPFLIVVAGISWGLIGLFSTNLSWAGFNPVQITVVRCVITALVLGVFLLVFKPGAFKIRLCHIWMFLGTGVLSIAFFNVCYFACINLCGLSFAAILLYTAPCFVVVFSAFLFKERLTRQKGIALIVAFAGCLLVVGIGSGDASLSFVGITFGIGSGIGYALYSLFARVALKHYETPTVMFYTFLFASMALVPVSDPFEIVFLAQTSVSVLALMLGLALISTVLPFACYTVGLSHMETGKASIMAFIEPMVSLLIGVFVFHDVLTLLNCCGVALIILAVALLNVPSKRVRFLRGPNDPKLS